MALTREGNALFYLGGGQKNVSVNERERGKNVELLIQYLYFLATLSGM